MTHFARHGLFASVVCFLVAFALFRIGSGGSEPEEPRELPAALAQAELRRLPPVEGGLEQGLLPTTRERDLSVRPATHLVVQPGVVFNWANGQEKRARLVDVTTKLGTPTLHWSVGETESELWLDTEEFRLIIEPAADTDVVVVKDDQGKDWRGGPAASIPITIPGNGRPKRVLTLSKDGASEPAFHTITVHLPLAGPSPPVVARAFNNSRSSANPVTHPDLSSTTGVRTYGQYLRVSGTMRPDSDLGDLRFALFKRSDDNWRQVGDLIVPTTPRVPADGIWETELVLPLLERRFAGALLPLSVARERHSVAASLLHFTVMEEKLIADPPTITGVSQPGSSNGFETVSKDAVANSYLLNHKSRTFKLSGTVNLGTTEEKNDSRVVIFQEVGTSRREVLPGPSRPNERGFAVSAEGTWESDEISVEADGDFRYSAVLVQGNQQTLASNSVLVRVRTNGPRIVDISPQNRLIAEGRIKLTTYFNRENPLNSALAKDKAFYVIKGPGTNAASGDGPQDVIYDATDNAVTLVFQDYQYDGNFVVSITPRPASGKSLNDLFGNTLELDDPGATSYDIPLVRTRLSETPSVAPGISHTTGPYVPFHEFTGPRESTSGFNPNDKVETRVARLYYYRDAHRVAQIINRKVKSYNRQAVDMARQLADRARQEAERRTRARQAAEREAIRKAEETRAAERDLQAAEQQFAEAARSLNRQVRQGTTDPEQQRDVASLEELVRRTGGQVDRLRSTVQQLRGQEAQANEQAQVQEALEQAAVADQFRQEVAAAAADPDTFAPGVPDSYDPVEQVSVSVIGEGLIHLRGPLKGINIIRTMIDQIDTPMGQVRVSVHTVQINGEREQRMEVVANRIQRYIDQARFLTLQCGEMLRRAVVQVAARKAEEARALYPESTQHARDQRYLYAFFGEDFVEELRSLDSEFLRTGNKLLSLHSMDTTSLSSALTLMALAKNSTRQEIFAEFDQMMATELPAAEARNLEAGMAGCEGDEKSGCKEPPPFYPLAQNARFESLRAFFNGEIGHDDTMTPLQREFIRLAQILKSRLITELEYKQRVTERAIIEELLGNRLDELRAAKTKEEKAGELYDRRQEAIQEAQVKVVNQVAVVTAEAGVVDERLRRYGATAEEVQGTLRAVWMKLEQHSRRRVDRTIQRWATEFQKVDPKLSNALKTETDAIMARYAASNDQSFGERTHQMDQEIVEALNRALLAAGEDKYPIKRDLNIEVDVQIPSVLGHPSFIYRFEIDPDGRVIVKDGAAFMRPLVATLSATASEASTWINDNFNLSAPESEHLKEVVELLQRVSPEEDVKAIDNLSQLLRALERISSILVVVRSNVTQLTDDLRRIARGIDEEQISGEQVLADWYRVRDSLLRFTRGPLRTQKVEAAVQATQKAFDELLDQAVRLNLARKNAANSRRPLDHKKFLDQLIDDLEEKYIELLEGTRAHTANIDNYLKRLTTALDDDFNTQFYFPTFRFVREASTYWDVQFGQTETTSILANNRQFAKVLPGATMEFDLPARDILLVEAVNGAKALIDDVGALANDPTFLAAARLQGPFSTASPPRGTTNGLPPERNVLSGLSTDTAERLLAQNSGSQNQFGANLENLIPDPAIYKFETGTGYEIRPVIQPDGQAVVFDFNYLYTTNVREPVRADEKHLGRVKRHFIHTDVQLSNFELREVSRYQVALKAARTSRGVPLFEDVPVVGVLFRPLPSQESSLQQNLVMAQATIFPTLFDLMGLRWAPVVADVDPMQLSNREFIVRGRQSFIQNRVYDEASSQVDHFLRIPESLRRPDLYRSQYTIPRLHPNGYNGAGLDYRDSTLQEGYQPNRLYPQERFAPPKSQEGAPFLPHRNYGHPSGTYVEEFPVQDVMPRQPDPRPLSDPGGRNVPSVAPGAAAPGRWTPASGGGQPGQPEPNALPTPPSINAPLPAGGGPQFPHHQAPPFSVLVPAQGQVVTPSQPQQLRQTPAAQMSSRASHFQPGSQDR